MISMIYLLKNISSRKWWFHTKENLRKHLRMKEYWRHWFEWRCLSTEWTLKNNVKIQSLSYFFDIEWYEGIFASSVSDEGTLQNSSLIRTNTLRKIHVVTSQTKAITALEFEKRLNWIWAKCVPIWHILRINFLCELSGDVKLPSTSRKSRSTAQSCHFQNFYDAD